MIDLGGLSLRGGPGPANGLFSPAGVAALGHRRGFFAERASSRDPVAVAVSGDSRDLTHPPAPLSVIVGRRAESLEPSCIGFDRRCRERKCSILNEVSSLSQRVRHVPRHRAVSRRDQPRNEVGIGAALRAADTASLVADATHQDGADIDGIAETPPEQALLIT